MNEISLEEYGKLPKHNQFDIVFKEGDFIDVWIEEDKRFVLYSLYKFFVEVVYVESINKIIGIDSFLEGKKLEKYTNN